jgi:glycosyltransferase involved in cell wall biosynthesis
MKIAIVAPSPNPFTMGGAEKLWMGLYSHINKYTEHQAELIKVPVKESNFWSLIDSYRDFYKLNLSHFDMVISGKYPAWMVEHPNHHIYMLHPLRGLYDLYPKELDREILPFWIDKSMSAKELFERLDGIRDAKIKFPSRFAKEVIQHFDRVAMGKIKSFKAISKVVANRDGYFPKGAKVEVIYPPTPLEGLKSGEYRYFFTSSRLDTPKRIDLIIRAYKRTKLNIPLKIAGEGKEYHNLKKLIGDDKRIELLGYVSDEELVELYSNAYGVIYIPKEEDYGLVTIEAMKSKKGVITAVDSGGVLEFVEDRKSGLIALPNELDLAKKIEEFAKDLTFAKMVGKGGYQKVKSINWRDTVNRLLSRREKIVVVSTFPIYPPRGGGQQRVFNLYREIAKSFDVTVISLVDSHLNLNRVELAEGFIEIQIPKTEEFLKVERALEQEAGISVTDIAFLDNYELIPKFISILRDEGRDSDFIVSETIYPYPVISELFSREKIVYGSENVEYLLKRNMLKESRVLDKLSKKIFEVEKSCYLNSKLVISCSELDIKEFKRLYGSRDEVVLVPNGVDSKAVPFIAPSSRVRLKRLYGLKDKKVAIFIGSCHKPNIEATFEIVRLAKLHRDIDFLIIGGLDVCFKDSDTPKNLKFLGTLSEEDKLRYLSIADIALNPMLTGSGSNLKMLDYLASGVPTLTTEVGARGINLPERSVIIEELSNWSYYLNNLDSIDMFVDRALAREVALKYDWRVIAKNYRDTLKTLYLNRG